MSQDSHPTWDLANGAFVPTFDRALILGRELPGGGVQPTVERRHVWRPPRWKDRRLRPLDVVTQDDAQGAVAALQATDAGRQLGVHDRFHQLHACDALLLQPPSAVFDANLPGLVDVRVKVGE